MASTLTPPTEDGAAARARVSELLNAAGSTFSADNDGVSPDRPQTQTRAASALFGLMVFCCVALVIAALIYAITSLCSAVNEEKRQSAHEKSTAAAAQARQAAVQAAQGYGQQQRAAPLAVERSTWLNPPGNAVEQHYFGPEDVGKVFGFQKPDGRLRYCIFAAAGESPWTDAVLYSPEITPTSETGEDIPRAVFNRPDYYSPAFTFRVEAPVTIKYFSKPMNDPVMCRP